MCGGVGLTWLCPLPQIVIGGDGTFFQCVNGMLQRQPEHRVPIGVIPGGSGNSVMADLGIRGHNEEGEHQAMDYCLSGDYAWVDVNQVTIDDERRIFSVNELTWGLTGDVGADSEKGRCFGPLRYAVFRYCQPCRAAYRLRCRVLLCSMCCGGAGIACAASGVCYATRCGPSR